MLLLCILQNLNFLMMKMVALSWLRWRGRCRWHQQSWCWWLVFWSVPDG